MGDTDEVWMDPEQLRVASSEAANVAEVLGWEASIVASRLYRYEMDEWGPYATEMINEVAEELGLLSRVATEKASQIGKAANDGYEGGTDDLISLLEASLDDAIGATGTVETDDSGYTVADAEAWLERNPDYGAWAFQSEMRDAVISGNEEAIAVLSASLWPRIRDMNEEEIWRFVHHGIGEQTFMIAVEASPPPPDDAVIEVLVDSMYFDVDSWQTDEWWDEYHEPFASYLATRYGIMDPDDKEAWASNKLLEFSRIDKPTAKTVLEATAELADFSNYDNHPVVGELVRTIVKENPETLKTVLGDDLLAQKVVDIMVVGSSELEVQTIFLDYAEWATSRFGPAGGPADYGLSIGVLYRAITKTGHGIGYDWSALVDALLPWAEFAVGGLPPFTSMSALGGLIIEDNTYEDLADGANEDIDKINAALVILMLTDPAAAQVIINRLATEDLGPGAVTRDQWNDRTDGQPVNPPLQGGAVYCTADTIGDRATNFCVPTLEQAEEALATTIELIDGAWQ